MSILDEILRYKRQEIAWAKKNIPVKQLRDFPYVTRRCLSLDDALQSEDIAIIAEIKKASPSKNIIRHNFHPLNIALEMLAGGASAISVLTDQHFFRGNIRHISDIRDFIPLPLLRKDFIIDSYQLLEAKAHGTDAVLLIAAALKRSHLRELHDEATTLGLECLVEIHHQQELETLDMSVVRMVGINNRNLLDFSVDLSTTFRIASKIPSGITVVSESGIASRSDLEKLRQSGIHAVLIGETIMRSANIRQSLHELLTPMKTIYHES